MIQFTSDTGHATGKVSVQPSSSVDSVKFHTVILILVVMVYGSSSAVA